MSNTFQGKIVQYVPCLPPMNLHNQAVKKSFLLISIFGILLSACKSLSPINEPEPSPVPPAPVSEVNVPVLVPKTTLTRLINSQVPQTLIQENGMGFGTGIEGDLLISRNGPITWTALDSQLIELKVPIKILGEVGLKKSGLGNFLRTKLPLNETLEPIIVIDPVINPDWSVGISSFELIDLGGNLDLEILGMELDLTDLLRKEIKKRGEQYFSENATIVNLKPIVDLAWAQVGKPFQVELEGIQTAFSIQPQEIQFKEFFDQGESLNIWLGLKGKVNSHPASAAPSRAFPLPDLSANENGNNQLDILMPLTLKYEELDRLLAINLDNKVFRIDKKTTMIPSEIRTQAYGELVAVSMNFFAEQSNGKTLEGSIFAVGKPMYDSESRQVFFKDINFKLESGNLGAQTTASLKKRKIIKNIEKRAVFPIGELLDESLESIQDRLGLATPIASLQIQNLQIDPAGFYPTQNGLMIQIAAKGTVGVDWN